MTRLDWLMTGIVLVAACSILFLVGAVASVSGLAPWLDRIPGFPSQESLAQTATLPEDDVPGQDIASVERYPGSVRVKYERYDLRETEIVEVGYLVSSEVEDVVDFYAELASSEGWRTVGSDVSPGDELGLLMARGEGEDERRIFIEIERDGDFSSAEVGEVVAAETTQPTGTG